jgi:hypothetical protein
MRTIGHLDREVVVAVAATAAVADPGIAPNPSLAKPGMGIFWVGPLPFDLYPISD